MISQANILPTTPMGANLVDGGGATFRVWAPRATAAYVNGIFAHGWQAVTCVENHDLVAAGRDPRLPALADGSNPRSWYARSRSRFATGLLLTASGIPQIFMGQEFLENRQWNCDPTATANLIEWAGLNDGTDPVYDNWVNPMAAGNGGGVSADGGPLHGFSASANIVIPANGMVVFARDGGD